MKKHFTLSKTPVLMNQGTKRLASRVLAFALSCACLVSSGMAWGQTAAFHLPGEATMTDCYPGQFHTSERQIAAGASSVNGAVLTPQGNLKILVIFAGYDEEADPSCPS